MDSPLHSPGGNIENGKIYRSTSRRTFHECPTCIGLKEDADIFSCSRFSEQQRKLEMMSDVTISPEIIIEAMLTSEDAWNF